MTDDAELSSVRRGGKSEAAFRTISEVSDELDVPQHVLRFWEGKFPQVKPLKRGGGRRYYRPDDVALLRRIRDLLYSEGYTIKGVQKLLKEGGASSPSTREGAAAPRPADAEPQLGLDIHDPDAEAGDDDLPDEDDIPVVAAGGGMVPAPRKEAAIVPETGRLSPMVRRDLEDLLAELEQLRSLLQPR